MADFEINIPASAVKLTQKGDNMAFTIGLNLTIGGNVAVSGGGGSAIDDAIAASSAGAFKWFTDSNETLFSDTGGTTPTTNGGAVAVMKAQDGTEVDQFEGTITWDGTNGLLDFTGAKMRLQSHDAMSTNMAIFAVMETTDTDWMFLSGNSAVFVGCAQDGSTGNTSINSGTPTVYVNGVALTTQNRDVFRDTVAAAGKCVVSIRGADLTSEVSYDGTPVFMGYASTGFQYTGKAGDWVYVDEQGDTVAAAIEAELAARHGITL